MESADSFVVNATTLFIVLFLATAVLFVVWAWRATKNLQAWEAPLRRGPGWAIGGWFIPVGNLWIGYQVVRDAWELAPDRDGKMPGRSLTDWNAAWALFLLSNVVSRIASNLVLSEGSGNPREELEDLILADRIQGTTDLAWIAGGVFLFGVLRKIRDRHDRLL